MTNMTLLLAALIAVESTGDNDAMGDFTEIVLFDNVSAQAAPELFSQHKNTYSKMTQYSTPSFRMTEVKHGRNPSTYRMTMTYATAVGCLQIWPIVVEDCNRILGWPAFTLSDRLDRAQSISMFYVYTGHYCTAKRLGREPTWEDAARIWNGGPNGYRKDCTKVYWAKVQKALGDAVK